MNNVGYNWLLMSSLLQHKKLLVVLVVAVTILAGFSYFLLPDQRSMVVQLSKPSEDQFLAPGKDWPSDKKVEEYFVEHLRMTPQEAQENRTRPGADGKVMLRVRETMTLEGLLGNLEYYGLVRDKEALRYALENTQDTVPGHANPIMVGNNTIDTWAYYRISEEMTAWEIADQLLNHPTYFAYDEYNNMFMP